MAGFVAAQLIDAASRGAPVLPLLDHERPDGKRHLVQIARDRLEDAAAEGMKLLGNEQLGAARAVLGVDAFVTIGDWRTDAIALHAHLYEPQHRSFTMAVPYRPRKDPAGFAVHRPKFLSHQGPPPDYQAVAAAFFRGVQQHTVASPTWQKHFDRSR
jgi:hypothetical protein